MRTSRTLSIVAGTAAIVLASLTVAAPASAATIASGQKITVIDLIQAEVGPTGSRFFDVDPANAAVTAVGNVQAPDTVYGLDVNDEGVGYAIAFYSEDSENPGEPQSWVPVLLTADAKNGTLGDFVDIVPTVEITINLCTGIDLQPNGEIIVACLDLRDGLLNSYIGVVTPEGAFTPFISSGENDVEEYDYTALAFNGVTGELWAFAFIGENDDEPAAFLLNRAAGTQGPPIALTEDVYGADFDRNGQLFVSSYDDATDVETLAATVDLATGVVTVVGPYSEDLFVESLTVWGKPALAATGSPVDALPAGLGAALLLLAGAAFIATQRISRKAA